MRFELIGVPYTSMARPGGIADAIDVLRSAGIAAGRAAGMTVWAVATTHDASELGDADRVAPGLPEHLHALV